MAAVAVSQKEKCANPATELTVPDLGFDVSVDSHSQSPPMIERVGCFRGPLPDGWRKQKGHGPLIRP
ncbi:MAG: hypothetical protein ACOC9Z_04295, partial [Chloroflexota bacterium]